MVDDRNHFAGIAARIEHLHVFAQHFLGVVVVQAPRKAQEIQDVGVGVFTRVQCDHDGIGPDFRGRIVGSKPANEPRCLTGYGVIVGTRKTRANPVFRHRLTSGLFGLDEFGNVVHAFRILILFEIEVGDHQTHVIGTKCAVGTVAHGRIERIVCVDRALQRFARLCDVAVAAVDLVEGDIDLPGPLRVQLAGRLHHLQPLQFHRLVVDLL